jgi:DNA-binding NarL/FixJ family response regulator
LEHAGFEVCGEAADGVEGIEQAKKLKPDLIVLDLAMPRMNGAEAASVLSTTMPDVPIVLLTLYQNALGPSLASALGVKAILATSNSKCESMAAAKCKIVSMPACEHPTIKSSPLGVRTASDNSCNSIVPGVCEIVGIR